jgi:peptidoglycan hydrolase-like amidase
VPGRSDGCLQRDRGHEGAGVAARTYAVGNLGGRETLGFDFYATMMDQVYGGVADEDSIVNRAVRETAARS